MIYSYKQSAEHVRKRMESKAVTVSAKQKPFDGEWLRARYIVDGLDCVKIGALLSRDPKTVWSWLRYYGIQTRPRGHDTTHLSKGREPGFSLSAKHKQQLRDARLNDGHVPYLKNGSHWLESVPKEDHPNWKGGLTPERQAFYLTEEWKCAVKAVWHRANARCERCRVHHNTAERRGTFHVHHIVSFMVRELRAAVDNLALLCKKCHLFVHSNANSKSEFIRRHQ